MLWRLGTASDYESMNEAKLAKVFLAINRVSPTRQLDIACVSSLGSSALQKNKEPLVGLGDGNWPWCDRLAAFISSLLMNRQGCHLIRNVHLGRLCTVN